MAAAAKQQPGKRTPRRMFMPYDKTAAAVVQPPAHLAHLTGDDLYDALIADTTEKWYTSRFVAEIGRSKGRFKAWMVNYYDTLEEGYDPSAVDDRVMVKPDGYDGRSPWWYAGTARRWAIGEGLMRRDGTSIPYKPTGRPKGKTDSVPRQRTATMRAGALEVLAACEKKIAAGKTLADAKAQLAREYAISERAVARRLTTGREMRAAGVREITPNMNTTQVAEIVRVMYQLLMADGRRKYPENARADVADRLGLDRAVVDRLLTEGTGEASDKP